MANVKSKSLRVGSAPSPTRSRVGTGVIIPHVAYGEHAAPKTGHWNLTGGSETRQVSQDLGDAKPPEGPAREDSKDATLQMEEATCPVGQFSEARRDYGFRLSFPVALPGSTQTRS